MQKIAIRKIRKCKNKIKFPNILLLNKLEGL